MKNNYGLFILIAAVLFIGGLIFSPKTDSLGGGNLGNPYLVKAPAHSTTTITTVIKLLINENTARKNFTFIASQDLYLWFANSTTTSMTNNSGGGSSGMLVSSSTEWNMEDYGVIWPGKIYAIASSTAGVVKLIDFTGN